MPLTQETTHSEANTELSDKKPAERHFREK